MEVEYEATFLNIDKSEMRKKLEKAGAKLVKAEFLQKRTVFLLPKSNEIEGAWIRVRDEQDKITMSVKICARTEKIEDQKEIEFKISDFKKANDFLETIGCQKKAFQESKREIWQFKDVEISLDEWPFLEPFVEIESSNEEKVKEFAEKLGFDYKNARFCSTDYLYSEKYNLPLDLINNETPLIVFDMKNPFIR